MVLDRVDGEADDLHAAGVEVRLDLGQVAELGRADRGEVARVREQHGPGVADPLVEVDRPFGGVGLKSGAVSPICRAIGCVSSGGGEVGTQPLLTVEFRVLRNCGGSFSREAACSRRGLTLGPCRHDPRPDSGPGCARGSRCCSASRSPSTAPARRRAVQGRLLRCTTRSARCRCRSASRCSRCAIALPWRHRGEGTWKSRLVAVPAVLVGALFVLVPMCIGISETHKWRGDVGARAERRLPRRDLRGERRRASSPAGTGRARNGATVIVVHGGGSDRRG